MVPPSTSAPAPPSAPARADATERTRRLFEAHAQELLRFLRRRDADLAEDALSETFAVAVRRAADIPAGRELPWLYVVAEHVLRNLQRSRRRAARIPEALHPFTRHSTDAAGIPYVGEALGELPDRERILLTMTAFEGLSAHEAADLMGIPYGSARNALSSGRKRLAVALASAAAAVLVVGVLAAAVGEIRGHHGRALETLASSISEARIVHEVAIVRHDGRTPAGSSADAPARYERWSDPDGDRTRVRLPGGGEVVAGGDRTLRSASGPATASKPAARRRAVREDLGALDAASPTAIAALLQDPVAQRTATDGPEIAGHDTTTLRGRIADAAGVEHAVRVFVADDEPTVLRVRVREPATTDGRGARTSQASTVDFVAWTAVPRQQATQPTSPRAAAPTPTTPVTPALGAANSSSIDAGSREGAAGDAGRETTTSDSGGEPTFGSADAPSRGRTQPVSEAVADANLASAPILHVRQSVMACYTGGGPGVSQSCVNFGDRETWHEVDGKRRSRSRTRRATGQLRNEEWLTPTVRSYLSVTAAGNRMRGRTERLSHASVGRSAPVGSQWRGEWLRQLGLVVGDLPAAPDALAALPPGPDIDGRPTRLRTYVHPDHVGNYTVDVAVDPSTGAPRQARFHRTWGTSEAGDTVTMKFMAWERIAAGHHADLLTRRFPKGIHITRE